MARRRGQRTGYLYRKSGNWMLRWREYHRAADGTERSMQVARAICPLKDPESGYSYSRKEAQRIAWEVVLSKLEQTTLYPQTLQTLADYWTRHFEAEHIWSLKPAGKSHYAAMWKHVEPALGKKRLKDIERVDVIELLKRKLAAGLSRQTVRHIRNLISAVFRHAEANKHFHGPNPAGLIRLPEEEGGTHSRKQPLTFDRARQVFARLPERERTMAALSVLSGMNVAELAGLRWRRVNVSDRPLLDDGDWLPPGHLAVKENFYRGQFCSTKTGRRRRMIPLAEQAMVLLTIWREQSHWRGPEDLVFAGRNGHAYNELNGARRVLRPLGRQLGLPFSLGWHTFRHTTATLLEALGVELGDRMALLGHTGPEMTMHYSHEQAERLKAGLDRLASMILRPAAPKGPSREEFRRMGTASKAVQ